MHNPSLWWNFDQQQLPPVKDVDDFFFFSRIAWETLHAIVLGSFGGGRG